MKELDMRTWQMCGNKHLMFGIGSNECPECEQYFLHDLTEEINAIIKDTQDKADLYWRKLMNSGKGMYELGRKDMTREVGEMVEIELSKFMKNPGIEDDMTIKVLSDLQDQLKKLG